MEMLVIGVIAIVAFAAVLIPLFRRTPRGNDAREFATEAEEVPPVAPIGAGPVTPVSPAPVTPADAGQHVPDDIEAEVARYRAALRAGTICRKCGQANTADSVFCADCGAKLPLDDAREFE